MNDEIIVPGPATQNVEMENQAGSKLLSVLLSFRFSLNIIWQLSAILMISQSLVELEESKKETVYLVPFYLSLESGLIILIIKSIEILSEKYSQTIIPVLLLLLIPSQLICFCWCFTEFNEDNVSVVAISCLVSYLAQLVLMITKIPEKNYRMIENFSASTHIPSKEVKTLFKLNQIWELSIFSDEFKNLRAYFDDGRAHDFNKNIEIRKCYQVDCPERVEIYKSQDFDITEKRLLWHGTKMKNIKGILEEGFKLPDHDMGMFGPGIYFADRMSKSAQYCDQGHSGVLFLCEVALGTTLELCKPVKFSEPPEGYDSVKGIGKFEPNQRQSIEIDGRVTVPTGRTVYIPERRNFDLKFNEFIVYDSRRILIKYIVKFNWLSRHGTEC